MSQIVWDAVGEHLYETGVDHGVHYMMKEDGTYGSGVAWNGLSAVNESPSGGEPTAIYADNQKYLNLMSAEEFGATIEAFTYPDQFAECDGSAEIATGVYAGQQPRKPFGFSYRSKIGNDVKGDEYGYKLHLVYNALASPSEKNHATVNETPGAETMSWEISTTPVSVPNHKPTAHIVIDSTKADATKLAALEAKLYGSSSAEAVLPLPEEVITLL